MKICCLLVFLVIVQEAYCGIVEKNGETEKEVEVITENEVTTACGLEPQDIIADSETSKNSPLLYEMNIDHPSLDGNSDSVKHKRCHHSYSRVGASLEPRVGIVGAKAPQAVQRRDLQNKLYAKACSTCLGRCELNSNCPVCEKWCSKAASNDEPNEVDANNVVGAPQAIASPEEPVMSVRSNFDDEKRKNVYTITTLKTGSIKELIMKVLGVSNPEDIDTVVIWVTTRSNHPPFISRDFNGDVDLEGEKAAEALKKELKSKMQKFHQSGKKFVKEGEEGMDNLIRNIFPEVHPKIPGSKGVDNSKTDSLRSGVAPEMLPRYPIESEPLIVPQMMNPGIIEGPPNFKTTDGESEDLDHLEASHDQAEEGSYGVPQKFTDGTVSLPNPSSDKSRAEEGSVSHGDQTYGVPQRFTDGTVSLPNPSSDRSRVDEESISQGEQTLGVPQWFTDRTIISPNQDSEDKETQPPDFLLRTGNQPEIESLPLDSRPRPFAANQGQEKSFRSLGGNDATGDNNLGTPIENSFKEKFETMKKNTLAPGMDRVKDPMAPGARLREFIDNVKANIVSSKNAFPNQRTFLDRIKSGDLESVNDAPNTVGRSHHNGGKGHEHGHRNILHPHNHRTSSQDDNIALIYKPKDKIETIANTPDPGPLIQKLPLPINKTVGPIAYPTLGGPIKSTRFSEQNKDDRIVPETDTRLGTKLEENADSDNHDARSSIPTHGHSQGHVKDHHQGHGQGHHQGHGQWHGKVHHPGPMHGHGKGHFHRSSELGNPETLNTQSNPGYENEMLAEPAPDDSFDLKNENPKNNPVGFTPTNSVGDLQSGSRTETPVKFNVGARANELIQKLKERQEMRKASLTLQNSPLGASRNNLGGSARKVEGTVRPSVDSGRDDSRTVGAQGPFRNPEIKDFENAEAALGEVSDLSKNLQEITDTGKPSQYKTKTDGVRPKHVSNSDFDLNTIQDESKKLNVGMNTPDLLGSQPLENSLERIQPSMSLSGRPWRNQNSANAFINDPKNEMVEEPSLGSANPDGNLENQNLNVIAGPETVAETNPDMNTRGQFEGDQNSFSNSMGAIVYAGNPADVSSQKKPSDVYFTGTGIMLPLKMAKGSDGVLHLSVDLDKLCSCNNITCPKNHTVLEKAVETILENEADELKEQLEPVNLVGEGIEPHNMQADYGDMPLGMASPQGLFEDGPTDLEERVEMQPRIGAFEEDAMEGVEQEQMAMPHRNQRDTDEESRFLARKNKIAGDFNPMKLQSNSEILEKSPEVIAVKSGIKSLQAPMKKFAVTPTHTPYKSGDVNRQQNLLLKNSELNDGAHASGGTNKEYTKTTLPSEVTTKTVESIRKTSSPEPNNLEHFMNKKLDDIRSKLEITNEDIKKDLSFPEYFFKNLWAAGKEQAEKLASNLNTNNPPPTLGSRLGSLFGKTAAVNNELYENLAPITKPYKFKALENQLKSNLEHIGDSVDNYTKRDDDILKEEVAAMDKITKNPVVRKEVGIVSNILKFFKDLAADKNKKK